MQQTFVHSVLRELTATQKKPVYLIVGDDINAIPKPTVFFQGPWSNDNDEAYRLSGLSYRSKKCRCRRCTVRSCDMAKPLLSFFGNRRDSSHVEKTALDGQSAILKEFTRPVRRQRKNWLSAHDMLALNCCVQEGIQPGLNPLYEDFEWTEKRGLGDIFSLMVVDKLHTADKGETEWNIGYSVAITYLCNGKSLRSMALVDRRLKKGAYNQSIQPFSKKSTFSTGNYLRVYVCVYVCI